jgi:hypothetical protein
MAAASFVGHLGAAPFSAYNQIRLLNELRQPVPAKTV